MDWHPVISVQQQTPDNDFCHFSISNVRFAIWAFFRKPEKLWSHNGSKWWPGDPDVKDDPNDPLTRWPNDPPSSMSGRVAECWEQKLIQALLLITAARQWYQSTCKVRLPISVLEPPAPWALESVHRCSNKHVASSNGAISRHLQGSKALFTSHKLN